MPCRQRPLCLHAVALRGWGIAAVEAQAAGKAVLARKLADLQDAVRHGETGHLVVPEDVSALADGMRYLLDSESVRAQMEEGLERGRVASIGTNWRLIRKVYLGAIKANGD